MGRFAYLTRAVWLSSLISLFTDLASEMLYPVMPLYLQSIGFSVFFIGLLEGAAEAVAGLLPFVVMYGGVALAHQFWGFAGFFAHYGLYAAATEGVSKAFVSTLCSPADTGAALAASTGAGLLWQWSEPGYPFGLAAVVALGVASLPAQPRYAPSASFLSFSLFQPPFAIIP